MIIGEATKRLSSDLRAIYPDVPWQSIAGFRDVLIHDYLKVNINQVWGVIEILISKPPKNNFRKSFPKLNPYN